MLFKHSATILYSSDVRKSLHYYTEVLGFVNKWEWDDPPTFGGVSKDAVELFFCKEGQGHPGSWLSIFVDNVDTYYEAIKARGAKIICEPETMEWGIREMLVEDPDGHRIRFGHHAHSHHNRTASGDLPGGIRLHHRMPTPAEAKQLAIAIGWSKPDAPEQSPPEAVEYAVVAEDADSGQVVGSALLLGDRTGFYYVRNVMVHPDWQNRHVGTAIMQAITDWLDQNAPDNASVGLHTGEGLASFYRQFGFTPAFGMMRHIKRF